MLNTSFDLSAEEREKREKGYFDYSGALAINAARMSHVDGYELELAGKSVLDVGCGVGHLAQYFIKRGADVFCVDGRPENIVQLRKRYPELRADVSDAHESLSRFGKFDIVFCYGLLYHTENPLLVIRHLASVSQDILLLETCVSDYDEPVVNFVEEGDESNQALWGIGCRPSPSFVLMALKAAGFPFAFSPADQPDYVDFRWEERGDGSDWRDGHPLRRVFIGARGPVSVAAA